MLLPSMATDVQSKHEARGDRFGVKLAQKFDVVARIDELQDSQSVSLLVIPSVCHSFTHSLSQSVSCVTFKQAAARAHCMPKFVA